MSTTDTSPRLALIGAGYWGKNLARNFNVLGALHTLCDANASTLANYAAGYEAVRKAQSAADVWSNPAITQVAVAAPAAAHYGLVKSAMEAGKDVFVEKPLCLDEGEAEELVMLAQAHKRILMVGHLLQYHPCVLKIQELLRTGELGKLHYITSNRLNLGKIRREENALWSFAPHDISVILSLAGNQMPEQVRCVGEDYLSDGVADTTLTSLRFADRVRAHVYVTWLNPFKEQKLTVVGSRGMAVFDDTRPWPEKLVVHRDYLTWANGQVPTPSNNKGETVLLPESEPLRNECQHFLDCCRDRTTPRTDGREGLRVLRVLQMAQRSLEGDGEAVGLAAGASVRQCIGGTEDRGQRTEDRAAERQRAMGKEQGPTRASESSSGSMPLPLGTLATDEPTHRRTDAPPPEYFVHESAFVDEGAVVGKGTKIWHFSHVMKGAQIGERCILGQNVNVDGGVRLGNNVKVQNNVSIYTGAEIEDDVFLGPSCVLTNVTNPRSQVNRHSLYERTVIKRGATVGANATIVCGVTLGRYCFIAAGAVVTKDVPDYALMMGNPARQRGWMSRHGHILKPTAEGVMVCPESGYRYALASEEPEQGADSKRDSRGSETGVRGSAKSVAGRTAQGQDAYRQGSGPAAPAPATAPMALGQRLRCLDMPEDDALPLDMAKGTRTYDTFKTVRSGSRHAQ